MLRKIILFFILGVFSLFKSYSQCCGSNQLMEQQITASPFKLYYLQYDGTPFLDEHWSNASITVLSGEVYKDLMVWVDLYKNEFITSNLDFMKATPIFFHFSLLCAKYN